VNLRWLLWFGAAAAGIWILATTLQYANVGERLGEDHVTLAIALMVYAIGYMGLRQPEVFRYQTAEMAIPVRPAAPPAQSVAEAADSEPTRYERSGLSEEEANALEAELKRVMDAEKPWKDSELTLPELAERVGSTPHKLSEVLNGQVGQTFYDFVNGYRVREVQRRIAAGEGRTLKILSLALDAGFASKSTFNQVFKKHTSQTPSDFRQTVGA
jgi:AraC-like DNA-binding protein